MNERMTLEARLHDLLVDLRPVDGAPPALRARVAALEAPPRWRDRLGDRLRRPATWLALAATAAAAVAIGVGLQGLGFISTQPGSGGRPLTPVPFDPTLEGPGLVRTVIPWLYIVPLAAAAIVGSVGLRWTFNGPWRLLRSVPVLLVAGVLFALAFHPVPKGGAAVATLFGYDDGGPGHSGGSMFIETAAPGDPVGIWIEVWNPGPLPIRVEGILEEATAQEARHRWTALWVPVDPEIPPIALEQLRPFSPFVVAPNGEGQLYIVGQAGTCAYGPAYDPAMEDVPLTQTPIQLAYSVLGLTSSATLSTVVTLFEPARGDC